LRRGWVPEGCSGRKKRVGLRLRRLKGYFSWYWIESSGIPYEDKEIWGMLPGWKPVLPEILIVV
ncbi:MAG: hypothetical protein KDD19_11535, partial [Phaeodactylibacter sp.]|nr:hypothetical protein [Phaeodactylibacter sp.]